MFELQRETHTVRGQDITICELSAGVLTTMDEAMSAAVAASLVPEKTQAEVADWPASVVSEIFSHVSALNGWDVEGKG
jgi:hypothetical protein